MNIFFKIILILISTSLFAVSEIELFVYWLPEAKGYEVFSLEKEGDLSLLSYLRQKIRAKGGELKSWELSAHRKEILSWKTVENFSDFWDWLFPKKVDKGGAKWVFYNFGPYLKKCNFSRIPKEKLILFLWEPPTVESEGYTIEMQKNFSKIFTWDDDLVDGIKFFKFYYPMLSGRIPQITSFEEKKLCVMVATRRYSPHPLELYSEREKVIRFFEDKPGKFDLFGREWEKRKYRNWKGWVSDKFSVIKNYKFCICYENMRDRKGYITEKIFDCFAAGTVPIYWGASNIQDYIPTDAFIDRRKFKDEEDLYRFIDSMSKEEYEKYLQKSYEFINSKEARLFGIENFTNIFLSIE